MKWVLFGGVIAILAWAIYMAITEDNIIQSVTYEKVRVKKSGYNPPSDPYEAWKYESYYGHRTTEVDTFVVTTTSKQYNSRAWASRDSILAVKCAELERAKLFIAASKKEQRGIDSIIHEANKATCK